MPVHIANVEVGGFHDIELFLGHIERGYAVVITREGKEIAALISIEEFRAARDRADATRPKGGPQGQPDLS
jgi:hypothetical protein